MSNPVLQLRVPEDTLARIDDTRSASVQLIDRELSGRTTTQLPAAGPLPRSPRRRLLGPRSWRRSTSRFGLRKLLLCAACCAVLEGQAYHRKLPESAAICRG